MKAVTSILFAVGVLLALEGSAEEVKVLTDRDLKKYKSSSDDSTYEYNQRVLQGQKQERGYQEATQEGRRPERESAERAARDNQERNAKLERIRELESQDLESKLNRTKLKTHGDFQRAKEERIKREAELNQLHREAGQSEERDAQKVRNKMRQLEQGGCYTTGGGRVICP